MRCVPLTCRRRASQAKPVSRTQCASRSVRNASLKKVPFVGRQKRLFCWPARRDSNPRPSESESAAISSFATGGCADIIAQKKAGSKSGGRAAQKYFSDGQQNWKKLLQKSEVSLIIYELLIFSATVAQLVEQLIRNQQVAGSSPASSSRKGTCFCRCFFFFYFACCTVL